MENYRQFAKRNQIWDGYYAYAPCFILESDKNEEKDPMKRNYAIAGKVCETFYSSYDWNSDKPQVGDVVEFSDGYDICKDGIVVSILRHGLIEVCGAGSSWTDGKSFSTSGGPFQRKHVSQFVRNGMGIHSVWTWGCHGAGAGQGIYFDLNVRKWLIPYEKPEPHTRVRLYGRGAKNWRGEPYRDAVRVDDGSMASHGFASVRAFLAWAEYVGFEYEHIGSRYNRKACQWLKRVSISRPSEIPRGAKPLKEIENGTVVDAWVRKEGDTICTYVPNINSWKCGAFGDHAVSGDEDLRLFRKYSGNPLGI